MVIAEAAILKTSPAEDEDRDPASLQETPVGYIPVDWRAVELREGIFLTSGHHVLAQYCNLDGHGVPYLTGPADFPEGQIVLSKYVTKPGSMCQAGDILVTVKGSGAGKTVRADIDYCISRQLMAVATKDWDSKFLEYALESSATIKAAATGLIPGISREDILGTRIPLPPTVDEQRLISSALSDQDELILKLNCLINKKRAIKQGVMQELLTGKRRLPGFGGGWQEHRLGDTAILKARIGWQGLTTAEYMEIGNFALVTGTEFDAGKVAWEQCYFVDESRYKQDPNIQLKLGDVLVTKDGTIGKVAYIDSLPVPATLNSGVFVVRPKDRTFEPKFFFYLLMSQVFSDFLSRLSAGSTINHLYQKDFVNFTYKVPPTSEEQEAISTFLSDMDAQLQALDAQLEKAMNIKRGMMQNLLTGKVRLV